jgi:hypothetical protein
MMTDEPILLTHTQRDEIMKAVAAIQRQLKKPGVPEQAIWIIGMNLETIRANLTDTPRISSN